MPRQKNINPCSRTTIYLEDDLVIKFKHHYRGYGDFSKLMNDLLRNHIDTLDRGEKALNEAKAYVQRGL
jgi:hypothetical protein